LETPTAEVANSSLFVEMTLWGHTINLSQRTKGGDTMFLLLVRPEAEEIY